MRVTRMRATFYNRKPIKSSFETHTHNAHVAHVAIKTVSDYVCVWGLWYIYKLCHRRNSTTYFIYFIRCVKHVHKNICELHIKHANSTLKSLLNKSITFTAPYMSLHTLGWMCPMSSPEIFNNFYNIYRYLFVYFSI